MTSTDNRNQTLLLMINDTHLCEDTDNVNDFSQ